MRTAYLCFAGLNLALGNWIMAGACVSLAVIHMLPKDEDDEADGE